MIHHKTVENLRPRAQAIAGVLAERLGDGWEDYTHEERLIGQPLSDNSVRFNRQGSRDLWINLSFLSYFDIVELDAGKTEILQSNIEDTYSWDIDILEGTTYDETLKHEFSELTQSSESWEVEFGLSVEANLGFSYGGVSAGVKVAGTYKNKKAGELRNSETTTNSVSRHFTFDGPKKSIIQAVRRRNRERRTITVAPNSDFKTTFVTNNSAWQFYDFATLFLDQLKGLEPEQTDFTPYAVSSSIRKVMIEKPLRDEELERLQTGSLGSFEVSFDYDSVTSQGIYEREIK